MGRTGKHKEQYEKQETDSKANSKQDNAQEPPSFSKIDTATLHNYNISPKASLFPMLKKANKIVCEILAGND